MYYVCIMYVLVLRPRPRSARGAIRSAEGGGCCRLYGQFSKFHVCFCGLDPGNLKFDTVRTNKQHICS